MNLQPCTQEREAAEARALLIALTGFSERAGHDMAGPLNQAATLVSLFIKRTGKQPDGESDQLLDYLLGASERMEQAGRGVRKFMAQNLLLLPLESEKLRAQLDTSRTGHPAGNSSSETRVPPKRNQFRQSRNFPEDCPR